MPSYNYVKFQRGTLAAYNALRTKDADTLYFIYADANDQHGALYLGNKLISGGDVTVVSSSLNDLTDVGLSNVQDGQILAYDSATSKWKNFDLATAISNAGIETGSTVSNITPEQGETDEEALEDISNPDAGDIAFVGDNIYIYDGTEWREIAGAQQEVQQRNLWTADRLYTTSTITEALTQEAQEKWDLYLTEQLSSAEFNAYYDEHSNDYVTEIRASVRKNDLIGDNSVESAIGDIVFAPDLNHPDSGQINSIYQIDSENGASWRLKSFLQGTYEAESRISSLETLVGQPSSGNNPATGLHAIVAQKIDATQANSLIASAIAGVDHLSYRKVGSLAAIDTTATNADRYIYLVPQSPGSLNDDTYDEYLVIDNQLEKMGQWGVGTLNELETSVNNLNDIINGIPASGSDPAVPGLVDIVGNLNDIINGVAASGNDPAIPGLVERVTILENGVGDLSQLFNYDAQDPITIVETINEINERLIWHDMTENVSSEPEEP